MDKRSKQARVGTKRPSRQGVVRDTVGPADLAYPGEVVATGISRLPSLRQDRLRFLTLLDQEPRVKRLLFLAATFAVVVPLAQATQLVGEVRVDVSGNAASI